MLKKDSFQPDLEWWILMWLAERPVSLDELVPYVSAKSSETPLRINAVVELVREGLAAVVERPIHSEECVVWDVAGQVLVDRLVGALRFDRPWSSRICVRATSFGTSRALAREARLDLVRARILVDSWDDWVPLRQMDSFALDVSRPSRRKGVVLTVVRQLLDDGLGELGEVGDCGFSAWELAPKDAIERLSESFMVDDNDLHAGYAVWFKGSDAGVTLGETLSGTLTDG